MQQEIILLRLPEVKRRTGLSRSSIYDGMARGLFPRSVHISQRAVAWDSRSIDAWVSARLAGREGEAA
ncbi:MAG: AlpA family phage regulatory protein [Desulfobacteraceae bacterium]|nr:AlpA family phage regulatory protein [Desulfobacteraceae bacterium]